MGSLFCGGLPNNEVAIDHDCPTGRILFLYPADEQPNGFLAKEFFVDIEGGDERSALFSFRDSIKSDDHRIFWDAVADLPDGGRDIPRYEVVAANEAIRHRSMEEDFVLYGVGIAIVEGVVVHDQVFFHAVAQPTPRTAPQHPHVSFVEAKTMADVSNESEASDFVLLI